MDTTTAEETIQQIFVYLYSLLFILGMIGNILAYSVFSSKRFRKLSFSIYFRTLTLTDSLTLFNVFRKILLFKYLIDLKQNSQFLCSTVYFISYAVPPISSWILGIISLDRMVSILRPTDYVFRNRKNFQIMICFSVIAFNFILYLPILIYSKLETIVESTFLNQTSNSTFLYTVSFDSCSLPDIISVYLDWMDLMNSTLVPFVLMILCTTITIRFLFKSRMKTRASRISTKNSSNVHYTLASTKSTHCNEKNQNNDSIVINNNQNSNNHAISSRDTKFAITSITLNLFFFIFNCPIVLHSILSNYLNLDDFIKFTVVTITSFVYYLNFATIFYINIFVNSIFKIEFYSIFFTCSKKT
jgi:hypothetical protein